MTFIPLWIAVMLAVPVGLFIAMVGAVLWLATRYKKIAALLSAVGILTSATALALFVFALR